ncbi:MAG TPA: tetratricopeptide repeat protein [Conexibacter sp.]|nr:tetratricopeptide repeat protein [Conexibacter sp.]
MSDADGQASAVCNVALAVARRGGWAAAQAQLEALAVPDARLGGVRDVNLGVLTMQGGDFAAALDCFDRAFAVGRELDDDPLKAAALNNAALAYALAGNVGEASPLLERAALLAQRIPDRIGNARAYNNIGVLNFQAGRLFEAIPYFEMALSLVEESGDRPAILEILNNNVLAFEQQYLEPATAFRTAFQAALDAGDRPHADRFVDAASMTMPTTRDGAGASELEPGQGEVLSRARALLWCALARC